MASLPKNNSNSSEEERLKLQAAMAAAAKPRSGRSSPGTAAPGRPSSDPVPATPSPTFPTIPGSPVAVGQKVPTSESGRGIEAVPPGHERGGFTLPPVPRFVPAPRDQTRPGIQAELMGRSNYPDPRMAAASAEAARMGGAAQMGGAGMTALGQMAAGRAGAGMQAQHEQTLRAIAAQRAGSRGPAGLAERAATTATGLAGAQLAGEAGKLQLQAAQAEAGAQAQQAQLDQQTIMAQGQFQQQTNLSNAEMEQKARAINLSVETDLLKERDRLIAKYAELGLTEDQYTAELDAALQRLKAQLNHDYWRTAVESTTALDVTRMQEQDWVRTGYLYPGAAGYTPEGQYVPDMWPGVLGYPEDQVEAEEAEEERKARERAEAITRRLSGQDDDAFTYPEAPSGPEDYDYYSGDRVMGAEELAGAYQTFRDQEGLAPPATPAPALSLGRDVETRVSDAAAREARDAAVGEYLRKPAIGPPTREQRTGQEFHEADQMEQEAKRAVAERLQHMDHIRKGIGAATAAMPVLTAKNEKERKRATLNLIQNEGVKAGVAKAVEAATSKWGDTAGGLVGAAGKVATAVGSELASEDDKRTDKDERVKYAAGGAAAEALGGLGGAQLGALAGTPLGPVGAGAGALIGGTLGSLGAGELFASAVKPPGVRTTNPQEMVGGAMGTANPTQLRDDPMSLMRARPTDINRVPFADDYARRQDGAFVGGPEDMAMPPEMMTGAGPPPPAIPDELEAAKAELMPANDSYDFLERLSSAAPDEAPPGGDTVDSQALSALGDLHERLKEIESLMGAGGI